MKDIELILHFRIKTESKNTLNEMYNVIVKHFNSGTIFNSRLLDPKYGKCGESNEFDIIRNQLNQRKSKFPKETSLVFACNQYFSKNFAYYSLYKKWINL